MNNKQILTKAIEKAYGYDKENAESMIFLNNFLIGKGYFEVIFSHSFAKAFWGEGEAITCTVSYSFVNEGGAGTAYGGKELKKWEKHLHDMVLSEEPLKYLEKYL